MSRRKTMLKKDTQIPLTATKDFFKPLTKCQRYCRYMGRCCCASHKRAMNEDLLRYDSLHQFVEALDYVHNIPSNVSLTTRTQERRLNVFDANAPAYAAFLVQPDVRPKPKRMSIFQRNVEDD